MRLLYSASLLLAAIILLPSGVFAQNTGMQGYLQVYADGHPVTFEDVPLDAWFTDAVRQAVTGGLASGYKDADGNLTGLFGPGDPVTYAQLAKMGLAAAHRDITATATDNVSAKGRWSQGYIATAQKLGLKVYSSDLDTNRPAHRGAVIQTLLDLWGIAAVGGENPYSDLPASHPYAKALFTATAMGIIRGESNNGAKTVRPDDPVNRAEMATLLIAMGTHPMGEIPPPPPASSSSSPAPQSSSGQGASSSSEAPPPSPPPPPPPPASSSSSAQAMMGGSYRVTILSNLHTDARQSAHVITTLAPGDTVTLVRVVDVWAEVKTSDGMDGYVAKGHLETAQ